MNLNRPKTIYQGWDIDRLKGLFARENWIGLSLDERKDLLQEYANLRTEKMGMDFYPSLHLDKLAEGVGGYYLDGEIHMNIKEVENDFASKLTITGQMENTEIKHSNFEAFETLCHEHQHAYQDFVMKNKIDTDNEFLEDISVNDGIAMAKDYPYRISSLYISAEANLLVYRLQPCENDAFVKSEMETDRLIEEFEDMIDLQSPANRESIESYQKIRSINGQEIIRNRASLIYGVENPSQVIKESLESVRAGNVNKIPSSPLERDVLDSSLRTLELSNRNENKLEENMEVNKDIKWGLSL